MKAPETTHTEYESCPVGPIGAVCTRVIDMGTRFNERKQKNVRTFRLYLETGHLMQTGDYAGQPFLIIEMFNFSMYSNSRLAQFIQAWLGVQMDQDALDKFDLDQLLNKPAFINVTKSEDGKFTNAGTIMPLPAGMEPLKPVGAVYSYSATEGKGGAYSQLTERVRALIEQTPEFTESEVAAPPSATQPQVAAPAIKHDERNPPPADFDDEIPF